MKFIENRSPCNFLNLAQPPASGCLTHNHSVEPEAGTSQQADRPPTAGLPPRLLLKRVSTNDHPTNTRHKPLRPLLRRPRIRLSMIPALHELPGWETTPKQFPSVCLKQLLSTPRYRKANPSSDQDNSWGVEEALHSQAQDNIKQFC